MLRNVRVPEVAQLRELVDLARSTPTGAAVMDELARVRTDVELFTAAEWLDDPVRAGTNARFGRVGNTLQLPMEPLPGRAASSIDPEAARAIDLVHEGRHRLQGRPGLPFVLRRLTIEPWQLLAAGRREAAIARAAGGGRAEIADATRRGQLVHALRDEVDAHLVDRQFGAELAAVRGRTAPTVPSRKLVEAELMGVPHYAWQARSQVAGQAAVRKAHVVIGASGAAIGGVTLLVASGE